MQEKKKEITKKKKKKYEFEYCVVCKLNHDQGPSHKYTPSHTKSLSAFLTRFQAKLSDVRFFLKNPIPLRPEHASRNRLWCVFCDSDVDELDSSFACGNAINHLANAEHLKHLKHFLWKYGGGMDRVDTFRISEDELAKWEKKCNSLKLEAVPCGEGSRGPTSGPSNDIHTELKYGIIDTFENNSSSSFSHGVMPLLYHTNEYQVSHSGLPQVTNVGCFSQDVATSSYHGGSSSGTNSINSNALTVIRSNQHSLVSNGRKSLADGYFSNERMREGSQHERMTNEQSSSPVFQNLTQISSMGPKEASGNVHTGAPPPWLQADEEIQCSVPLKRVSGSLIPPSNKLGKSKKLNPNRVGAAWAERRKREMEMEKRGEIVMSDCDASWLPNFGRVWQSGSRKESRKEFELEKQKLPKVESQSDMPIKIQPYISKRMRTDSSQ
ncbi:TITAN-like protein [Pyrus x bretschneideri]|uniref:TITAN-like protein n=1 Tax=Pyrus x bretschneideri TaxID=225117 RepID=UPI0020308481|nr:TITAN-like protein [Pyrus x bretschneideri]